MLELTPQQVAILERLVEHGFRPTAFPLYASHIGVRKGNCAVLLAPVDDAGMIIFGEPCYLVNGNLTVRVKRAGREWFVWKKTELEATPERLAELALFTNELTSLVSVG